MLGTPGSAVTQFIGGKRKDFQSPLSYFLIWITIYILFLYFIERLFGENVVLNYQEYFGPASTTKFAISHLSLVLVVVIPFQALYLFLLVTKPAYNYVETLVATIYSLGTIMLLQFLFDLPALMIHLISGASVDLRISDIFKILYLFWFIVHFIKSFRVSHQGLRILMFVILAFGTFTLRRMYGFPHAMEWFHNQHQ